MIDDEYTGATRTADGYVCGDMDWTSGVERMCVAEPGHVKGEHWYFDVQIIGED